MKNVMITGANRGIGLEFVRQLAGKACPDTKIIIATCRDPDKSQDLKDIQSSAKVPVKILKLDVTSKDELCGLLSTVQKILGPNQGLNLLINNAGYGPYLGWDETTQDEMNKMLASNATAPLMIVKALLPLLRMAADQSTEPGMSCSKAAIVNISSSLGSLRLPLTRDAEGARIKNYMGYSSSKAALNMCMRFVAAYTIDYGVLVIQLHPGWVQTDMGTSAAPLTAKQSVESMLNTICSRNQDHHGLFFDQNGKEMEY